MLANVYRDVEIHELLLQSRIINFRKLRKDALIKSDALTPITKQLFDIVKIN